MSSVDVVIPCYKYGRFLPACVESVLRQEGVEVRALIIDDASPDNSAEIAAQLAKTDSRVEFRHHQANRGHIATYNEGLLDWALGDYALLLSADDLLTTGALARAAGLMDAHPEVGLVFGRQIVFHTGDPLPEVSGDKDCGWKVFTGPEFLEIVCSAGSNPVPTPTALVRTRVQKQAGGYRPQLPHTGDREMWMRLALHGSVGIVEADQAYYRIHGTNMHQEIADRVVSQLNQWKGAYDFFFRECTGQIPDADRLRCLAYRSLGEQALWAASRAFDRADRPAVQECLRFSANVYPAIRDTASWSRLRWKRILGFTLWSALSPAVVSLRSRRSQESHTSTS